MGLYLACSAGSGVAQSLPVLPPVPNESYDDFFDEINDDLNNAARQKRFVPGRTFQGYFEICINKKVNQAYFLAFGNEGGFSFFQKQELVPTDQDCTTSNDFRGLDNSNQATLNSVLSYLQGGKTVNAPGDSKASRAANNPTLPNVPSQFSDVPFIPYYDPSKYPASLACNPSIRGDLMEVNHSSSTVTRIDGCSGTVIASITVVPNPLQIATVSDKSMSVVTSFDGALNFIDNTTNKSTPVSTPSYNPSGIAIDNDDAFAYVTSFSPAAPALLKVNLATRQIVATLPMPFQYPQSVTLNPEASQAYVLFPFNPTVVVVDLLSMTIAQTIATPNNTYGAAFNTTGTQAYIATRTTPGTVQVVDTATFKIIKSIQVSNNPVDLVVFGSDQLLFVGSYFGQSVDVIDLPSLTNIATIPVGGNVHGLIQAQ
jgi:hypothetical protein